jgi:hypothetical protein
MLRMPLAARQVIDRRSAVKFYYILAAGHGVVNPRKSSGVTGILGDSSIAPKGLGSPTTSDATCEVFAPPVLPYYNSCPPQLRRDLDKSTQISGLGERQGLRPAFPIRW